MNVALLVCVIVSVLFCLFFISAGGVLYLPTFGSTQFTRTPGCPRPKPVCHQSGGSQCGPPVSLLCPTTTCPSSTCPSTPLCLDPDNNNSPLPTIPNYNAYCNKCGNMAPYSTGQLNSTTANSAADCATQCTGQCTAFSYISSEDIINGSQNCLTFGPVADESGNSTTTCGPIDRGGNETGDQWYTYILSSADSTSSS